MTEVAEEKKPDADAPQMDAAPTGTAPQIEPTAADEKALTATFEKYGVPPDEEPASNEPGKADESKPEGDEKPSDGDEKPVDDKPPDEETPTLGERHSRMAKQMGWSDEKTASRIEKFGVEAVAEDIEDQVSDYARLTRRREDKPEPPKEDDKPPSDDIDLATLPEFKEDDEYEDSSAKLNALTKIVKQLAERKSDPRLASVIEYVEGESDRRDQQVNDAFFMGIAKEFTRYGDRPISEYAADSAEAEARNALLKEADKYAKFHPMSEALDMALIAIERNSMKSRADGVRQERRRASRGRSVPHAPPRKGGTGMTADEKDEQTFNAFEESHPGIKIPP